MNPYIEFAKLGLTICGVWILAGSLFCIVWPYVKPKGGK